MGDYVVKSEEVLYAASPLIAVTAADIAELKERAARTKRRRCRICLHTDPGDALHDMVIVHAGGTYDRPHMHPHKAETLTVLEGSAVLLLFADDGRLAGTVKMGAAGQASAAPMVRVPPRQYHALLIEGDWLVMGESTLGPFDAKATLPAAWSPSGEDEAEASRYVAVLTAAVAALRS
jgi:cupin fold WbuC family metalloprotein